ncbi:MAG: glycosyltransferase [Gammaproteobacteria bacterium]|nr:MAG: glycosyltransferase [Gammaproteobacteria bacterium]
MTGNIKFDFELPEGLAEQGRRFRAEQAPGRPIWIAASTHAGEEDAVIDSHREVLRRFPDALLLLVPRHPERFPAVAAQLERAGLPFVTRSSRALCTAATRVFLGDSMGELPLFYAAADLAFVAGSLVPVGGHNLLEPAALGVPALTGPYNFNAQDIADLLDQAGAVQFLRGREELAPAVIALLADPAERQRRGELARETVMRSRGALQRLLALLEPLIRDGQGADQLPG